METKMTQEQIESYLTRLQYTRPIQLDGATLKELQYAHLKSIPYENLDILNHIPISLEPQDLFRKMILHQRGGYCFETNGLYSWFLKSLGFQVTNFAGRFLKGYTGDQMRRHRVLKVAAEDGVFLCDVGVRSESPRYALLLAENEIQTDGFAQYNLTKDVFLGWVLWQKEPSREWTKLFAFTEEPQLDIDYVMASFYCEKHPDSIFNKIIKLAIFHDNGHIALDGNNLKFFEGASLTHKVTLERREDFAEAIKTLFSIHLPVSLEQSLLDSILS